jgi:hypothetical protein
MPGQSVRTRARFRMSLAIHPRELPVATSVTANRRSASVERSNVFAVDTLRQIFAHRNRKPSPACAETVDDSTSLWKPEEIPAPSSAMKMCTLKSCNNLHAVKK